MTGKKIIYKNDLSIAENARKNKCSEATIRRYIRLNNIDRKYDELYLKYKTVKELQAKHPEYTVYRIAKITGYSNATVKKYMAMDELYAKTCSDKLSTFDTSQKAAVVSSISKSQDEILSNILKLHVPSLEFDCDLTYSLGVFYRSLTPPQHRYDKFPMSDGVCALEDAYLLPDGCFNSVVVDLPFIIKSSEKDKEYSKVVQRFQCFTSKQELIDTNKEMLSLSYRLLKSGGILVMKLQNTNYAGQQIWTHYIVQEYAQQIGFELIDEFILEGKSRLLYESGVVQHHARKYHSYFLVFKKKRRGKSNRTPLKPQP